MTRMDAKRQNVRMRTCLGEGCGVTFLSEGAWNRKCPRCLRREALSQSVPPGMPSARLMMSERHALAPCEGDST